MFGRVAKSTLIALTIVATVTAIAAFSEPNGADAFVSRQADDGTRSEDDLVSFNRDIKPLLSDRCFLCHGPDEGSRVGGFRLDDPDSAYGEGESGETPIVPGEPDSSELIRRISLDADDDERMPAEEAHKPLLTQSEIELFRMWIEQGARYEKHWAFVAPDRPTVPDPDSAPDDAFVEWNNSPIDRFVLQRIRNQALMPSPPADKAKIIRRLTLDLTGLPPTTDEVASFLADQSPEACERVVDRLLASPRYGEHMARFWLDAVRYADTHGLHFDNYREIWPYRDWVIRAFNDNMAWNDFTTKQLAGDLLPDPTDEDLIASGYNRLHVTTNEGGSIKEEVYVRNVIDRVSTTGSVFLGLSVGCAQCHDHKFDPITAQDFYSMFAFFNNLDADPMDGNNKAHAPTISISTPEAAAKIAGLQASLDALNTQIKSPGSEIESAFAEWKTLGTDRADNTWSSLEITEATSAADTTLTFNPESQIATATDKNPDKETFEFTIRTDLTEVTAIRLEALAGDDESAGRAANGNAVLSEIEAEVRPANEPNAKFTPLRFVSADADHQQDKFPVAHAIDQKVDAESGWAIEGHGRNGSRTALFATDTPFGFEGGTTVRVRLRFESKYAQHVFKSIRLAATTDKEIGTHHTGSWNLLGPFATENRSDAYHKDFGPEEGVDLTAIYKPDGGRTGDEAEANDEDAESKKVTWQLNTEFADGTPHVFGDQVIGPRYLYREILSPGARKLTLSLGSDDGIRVFLNGELVHENNVARAVAPDQESVRLSLRSGSNGLLLKIVNTGGASGFYYSEKTSESLVPGLAVQSILRRPEEERTEQQNTRLREFFLRTRPEHRKLLTDIEAKKAEIESANAGLPTTLVMKERMEPKPAYLLTRGEYDQPDKERGALPRAVPGFLPPMPESSPNDRLGFAQWLLMQENPLMARVTVNRFWQQFFGSGIVITADDFGSQGTQPTHPELLDWLAVEFRESNWDVKALVKQMVMSRTYRQDSVITAAAYEADPTNQFLARGPRYRLDAETLRDQALSVSGLLVNKLGGPGVKPPQPDGLWKAVGYVGANTSIYKADEGSDKVHRRSIYTFWKRTSPPPEMTVFDSPTREECVISRERTNNPLQALLLLNDPQYFEAARHLAERVTSELPNVESKERAERMFYLATLRQPEPGESAVLLEVYEQQLSVFKADNAAASKLLRVGAIPIAQTSDVPELAAWTVIGNIVLNLDEVITKQ